MVIVNQNRDEIINFEKMNNIYVSKSGEVRACANMEDCVYVLGKYESEERAKEVLQEIVKQKAIFEFFKNVPEKTQILLAKDFKEDNEIFDTYEMPEK